jgi:hypothetical protein
MRPLPADVFMRTRLLLVSLLALVGLLAAAVVMVVFSPADPDARFYWIKKA